MTDAVHQTMYARPCEKCGGRVLAQSEMHLESERYAEPVLKAWLQCEKCGDVTPNEATLPPSAEGPN
jgi:hypothetical protein